MCENFKKIALDKQIQILNAAYQVFAEHSYKAAPTQDIALRAGISKGLLFYYFHNKHDLYFYLYDHGVNVLMDEINHFSGLKNPDYFQRMESLMYAKITIMQQFPHMYAYFIKAYMEDDLIVKDELNERLYQLTNEGQLFIKDIDKKRFRKNVDLNLLSNFIIGFATDNVRKYCLMGDLDFTELTKNMLNYLNMLKENFYKDEFINI